MAPLGESAGRSSHNPARKNARRRMDIDERNQLRPLHDDPDSWPGEDFDVTQTGFYRPAVAVCMWLLAGVVVLLLGLGGEAAIVAVVAAAYGWVWRALVDR